MDKIIFIRERAKMGITRPFICQTDTGKWVIVKTLAMMPLPQLLAEVFGSILAHKIALPSPEVCFVEVTLESNSYVSAEWRSDLPTGTAFASIFMKHAKVAKTAQATNINYLDETAQKLLYMFDRWILNSDRTASTVGTGNINLLFDEQQQKILVIDHNLAFDKDAQFDEHIFSPKNRNWRLDWVDKEIFSQKAIDILNKFNDIYQIIPDSWFPIDDEEYQKMDAEINRIKAILSRITYPHYWNNIE